MCTRGIPAWSRLALAGLAEAAAETLEVIRCNLGIAHRSNIVISCMFVSTRFILDLVVKPTSLTGVLSLFATVRPGRRRTLKGM